MAEKTNLQMLSSWADFETAVHAIEIEAQSRKQGDAAGYVSPPLFRGHANAQWKLATSLERRASEKSHLGVNNYNDLIRANKTMVESYTGRDFSLRDTHELNEPRDIVKPQFHSTLEYMAFLRHFGFPSPLLDWSRSPYVAAYFAFARTDPAATHVAVHVFQEEIGNGKGGWVGAPTIIGIGPNLKAHKRHFQQQSEYTICFEKPEDKWFYCDHGTAMNKNEGEQDVLKTLLVPVDQRRVFLRKLDLMNITALSLMGGKTGLLETIAQREFD